MKKIHEEVTAIIAEKLENGVNPWQKLWKAKASGQCPYNLGSKREYSSTNALMLASIGASCPAWVTFKQALDLGGSVKKGAKGKLVTFCKRFVIGGSTDETTEETESQPSKGSAAGRKSFSMLKHYYVFNAIDDCDGLEARVSAVTGKEIIPSNPHDVLFSYLSREVIALRHGGDRAYYATGSDYIQMPHESNFSTPAAYQVVLAHEIIHSTGHPAREKRDLSGGFGSGSYAFEELIAEIGSCMLCAEIGIEPLWDNSAAYLKGWAAALRDNSTWIISASSRASKAANFVNPTTETTENATASHEITAPAKPTTAARKPTRDQAQGQLSLFDLLAA